MAKSALVGVLSSVVRVEGDGDGLPAQDEAQEVVRDWRLMGSVRRFCVYCAVQIWR